MEGIIERRRNNEHSDCLELEMELWWYYGGRTRPSKFANKVSVPNFVHMIDLLYLLKIFLPGAIS